MLNTGYHKPPVAPKPKVVLFPKPGLSPASPREEGLLLPPIPTARKPKPLLAPKPILPKVTDPPNPIKKLTTVPDSTVGLLNSQNGLHQENKRPNWDYIIPICLCSNENCRCIKNERFAKMEKDLITQNKSKTETEHRKVENNNIVNNNQSKSPILENTTQNDSTGNNSNGTVIKNHKPVYSPLTNGPSLTHKVQQEAKTNVIPKRTLGLAPKEDKICSSSTTIQNSTPTRKPAPVPVPRKPRVKEQEKVEGEIGNQEVSEVSSELKNCPSVSVNTPAPAHLNAPAPIHKPTYAPPPPPDKKPFLSDISKSFSSDDVDEEDLGWDVHEMELSVDKSDDEHEKGDSIEEPIYNSVYSPISSPVQPKEQVIKLPPQKPLRRKSGMTRSMELVQDKDPKIPGQKEIRPSQYTKEVIMRQLPLPPTNEMTTKPTETIKSRSSSLNKAKSFSCTDASRPQKLRKNSFKKFLDLKLKKFMGKECQTHDTSSEDEKVQEYKGERKLSCPLIEKRLDEEVFNHATEQQEYYEDIPVYEDIEDYVNVNMEEEKTSPWEKDVWPSPMSNDDDDDEGLYEVQEPYFKLEKNTAPPHEEQYNYPRASYQIYTAEERLSDEDIMGNTTDEEYDDDFDTSSVSSKGEEPEQIVESATLMRRKEKIKHIATEIMTSENVFVNVLKLLHVDFRNAVFAASHNSGKPVIEDQVLDQILFYLPQLYELNQQLLNELQQRVATWGENSKVADIFVKKGAFLKMYSNYIREFDKNVTLLDEQIKKNPAFAAVVREFEASPRCANLALKHYLLKPVQRIPQYQLLLTDYLKNLLEDSADYKDTQEALVIVKEVANHANDIMKQGDIFQKLIQVQCRLIGNHEIVQPGRVFLKEGVVNKLSRKTMQPRMIFLFNDMLLYTIPVQSGQFKVKKMLSLAGMKVKKPSLEAFQNEFIIESVERSFICSASSATEREKWLEAFSTAISDFTKKKTSFIPGKTSDKVEIEIGAALGSKAPIWIPDPRATMCMICTCEFTLTWRRHHCRACGKVVCQSCSTNKYRLKYLKGQWARVCDQCFVVLQKQENEKAISCTASNKTAFAFNRKHKKIPAHLTEVSANTINSTMSGYLERIKPNKKQGKRMWFVIKGMVLYTYAASEDVAALKSQPLLGLTVKSDSKLQFRLVHKDKVFYIFKADDEQIAERWIEAMRKTSVLEA
ncbi:FYVE, RhoGEF and PH domain-containing protein 6-like [Periophthalmus magnuspinnatus]|uniref:FYVE, RhoGEF and PH domain-containing protein 6-like n=1 Tax=Periophthalmus magnuspinnatus TaxID=409849 RepID=UPI00145AFEEE|nr:FYVE, RhoGEF and PH domain-containing protein 6-like [Periophthalmus magnuspinnatus]